ncbi:MAG: zinc ribbon domain-containing protein [Planctomycetota bacterium]|jgi:hypothetical protein
MAIDIRCPECGWQTKAKDSFAGRTVHCKSCGHSFPVLPPEDDFEDYEALQDESTRTAPTGEESGGISRKTGNTLLILAALSPVVIIVLAGFILLALPAFSDKENEGEGTEGDDGTGWTMWSGRPRMSKALVKGVYRRAYDAQFEATKSKRTLDPSRALDEAARAAGFKDYRDFCTQGAKWDATKFSQAATEASKEYSERVQRYCEDREGGTLTEWR